MSQHETTQFLTRLVVILAGAVLTGCASTAVPYQSSKTLVPEDSRGSVVVYWHQESTRSSTAASLFTNLFGMDRLEVLVDDKKVGEMKPNTHAVLGIKRGSRILKLLVAKSPHDTGVFETVNMDVGDEVVFDVATDEVPSATTHYESGYWDDGCYCMIGEGEVPDYSYNRYELRKVTAMSKEGLSSGRSLMYIEP